MKKYVLVAGTNGVGKSTLYETQDSLKNIPRVNTDEIVRSFGNWQNISDVMKAGRIAVRMIQDYFENGRTFSQETTLCGHSIIRNIEKARELGYEIELHYVGVDSVQIAKDRVAYRVAHGGHGIPEADIERRYSESLERLMQILPICKLAVLYDNSKYFRNFATFQYGKAITITNDIVPEWYKKNNDLKAIRVLKNLQMVAALY